MNETEKTLYRKYEEQGYDVIHTGVPDLILLKGGKIEFVEIKAAADLLRESQIRAVALLEKHGFKVRVERVPDVKSSSLLRKWREKYNPNQSRPIQSRPPQPSPIHSSPLHPSPGQSTTPNQPNPGQTTPSHPKPSQASPGQTTPVHPTPIPFKGGETS